ncbi:KAP family P-loop NTPase fold protein [Caballeronia sp. HLA56]
MTNTAIDESSPFERDLLGRKAAAEFLTNFLVGRHRVAGSVPGNESFVLNVNAEWGLGKTYFLMEWAKMLRKHGHPVVYFDAWENDFSSDPFVGFMAEIEGQLTAGMTLKQNVRAKARNVIKKGARVIKASAPSIGFAIVKNFTGIDADKLIEAAKKSSPDVTAAIKRDLEKENKDVRSAITNFKSALADFALSARDENNASLPVFLMVDELDRCRPSFAIELLENIKHIFRVPNVYTIIATDSTQLAHSISAIYGQKFDSKKYLRRFFDHESRLDSPSYDDLAAAIFQQRNMLNDERLVNVFVHSNSRESSPRVLSLLAQALRLTTRDFQRSIDIVDSIRVTRKQDLNLFLLALLTMLYVGHSDAFDRYLQDPGPAAVQQYLKERGDMRITVQETVAASNSQLVRQAAIIDWSLRYLRGIWTDDIYNFSDDWMGVQYAIQNINSKTELADLRKYQDLVSGMGHFSM